MIEYRDLPNGNVHVYLDKKLIGTISKVANGYAYRANGSKTSGEILPTVAEIKATLEEM